MLRLDLEPAEADLLASACPTSPTSDADLWRGLRLKLARATRRHGGTPAAVEARAPWPKPKA